MTWNGEGDLSVGIEKLPILAHALPTFFLGQFFKCPPHSWDDLPPERVMLDYFTLSIFKEIEAESINKVKREQGLGNTKGRAVRTTSDTDFFERMNARLKDDG